MHGGEIWGHGGMAITLSKYTENFELHGFDLIEWGCHGAHYNYRLGRVKEKGI